MSAADILAELVDRDWTFCHRTLTDKGALGGAWLDHNGEERIYQDVPAGAAVGCIYTVRCTEDGRRASTKVAKYTGRRDLSNTVAEQWKLADAAARAAKHNDTEQRKMNQIDDLDSMTLADVRRYLSSLKGWDHRAAAVAIVLQRIGAA